MRYHFPHDSAEDRQAPKRRSGRVDESYYDEQYFGSKRHLVDTNSRFQKYRVRKVIELLRPQPNELILDLGCGWGTITLALAPIVREVVAVDFSSVAIHTCETRMLEDGVRNVDLRLCKAEETGLGESTVDGAVAADLFEHLYPDDSEAVAEEAFRVLKPGGRLAVWTPCPTHIIEVLKRRDLILRRDEGHIDYKTIERMKSILQRAGFEIGRAEFAESHLPGLEFVERLGQRWIPFLRRRIAVLAVKPPSRAANP